MAGGTDQQEHGRLQPQTIHPPAGLQMRTLYCFNFYNSLLCSVIVYKTILSSFNPVFRLL